MSASDAYGPKAPAGFARLNVWQPPDVQVIHLVRWMNGGTPGDTICGLTRFPERDADGRVVGNPDLAGWAVEGGTFGPSVRQEPCETCWIAAS